MSKKRRLLYFNERGITKVLIKSALESLELEQVFEVNVSEVQTIRCVPYNDGVVLVSEGGKALAAFLLSEDEEEEDNG